MSGRRIRAQAGMELRLLLRNGENLLVTIGIPAGLLLFFATVDVLDLPGDRLAFLLPGILTVALMSTGMVSLAIATGFERSYLVLKRLGATPLRRRELVAAKVMAVLAIEALQLAVLLTLAVALGWRAPPSGLHVGVAVVALVLGSAAFVGIGLAMAGRLRAVVTLALSNGVFVVLLLISGVVFPLAALPSGLASIATALPTTALATALRGALGGQGAPASALGILAGWALLAPTAAAALFQWEEAGPTGSGRRGRRRRPSP